MPNVIGEDEGPAKSTIIDRGFSVRVVRQNTSNEDEDGVVINQTPPAGTNLNQGETVTIYVGRFVEPPTTTTTSSSSTTTTTGP